MGFFVFALNVSLIKIKNEYILTGMVIWLVKVKVIY